ncbi:MAG: serine/threonine protein kinase [Micromonosporaceae bacterium]|nr:serine/threonine protein kinase [Micromonosporaceae bacterium]
MTSGPEDVLAYTVASQDYYLPLERAAGYGPALRPERRPPGWQQHHEGVWTSWAPAPGDPLPDAGWKVHVSARLEHTQRVLDTVARACVEAEVRFKHLATEFCFLVVHSKHTSRAQAGKFCTAYPPDVETARRLLTRLAAELDGEAGPYVLTDRRFGESKVVSYRYGAFRDRHRVRVDGTRQALVADATGRLVPDQRGVSFQLPAGITDPFSQLEHPAPPGPGPIVIGGYEVHRVARHSNAGGSYLGAERRSGRPVFLKEARGHNGLAADRTDAATRLRREHQVLSGLHRHRPGTGPEPLDYFVEWENEFLVTELVHGVPLDQWISRNAPTTSRLDDPAAYADYYARCLAILAGLDETLAEVHRAGYRFGDLSPGNIIIGDGDTARLVDFEAVTRLNQPAGTIGTDGFVEPRWLVDLGPTVRDDYGLAGVARAMLFRFQNVLQRSPRSLDLLRRDLTAVAPVPAELWRRAARFLDPGAARPATALPTASELDERPTAALAASADGLATAILASADPTGPGPVFPTVPRGYRTNLHSLAYGTAGVLHALHTGGYEIPVDIRERFRRDCLAGRDELPPGLLLGSAGLACVLAELGMVDEAVVLHQHATSAMAGDDLPLSLDLGTAGICYSCVRLHRHTADERLLDQAERAAGRLQAAARSPATELPPGLLSGWAGLARSLQALAELTGDDRHRELGRDCLRRATAEWHPGLNPDLDAGTAGVLWAAGRHGDDGGPDPTRVPTMVRDVTRTWMAHAGLFRGLAGLVWTVSGLAATGRAGVAEPAAVRLATRLVKYLVPDPAGRGWGVLGAGNQRLSCDLASGGAGVLLALNSAVDRRSDLVSSGSTENRAPKGG